jgi:hypothetical protein
VDKLSAYTEIVNMLSAPFEIGEDGDALLIRFPRDENLGEKFNWTQSHFTNDEEGNCVIEIMNTEEIMYDRISTVDEFKAYIKDFSDWFGSDGRGEGPAIKNYSTVLEEN